MPPKLKISAGARQLQDRLHGLLTNVSLTMEHVKNWPPTSDDNTGQLCQHVRDILKAISAVESTLQANNAEYQNCLIPLDLLELLEYNGTKTDKEYGLNPDCFLRGLLKEATGQLTGLKRRKLALERLGAAVQAGIDQRQNDTEAATGKKRGRDEGDDVVVEDPPEKKSKTT